jgi:hypothetical protein
VAERRGLLIRQTILSPYRISVSPGIDYIGYATGQTDKFQGTGVFSGIKMERTPPAAAVETSKSAPKEQEKTTTDLKASVEKK